MNMGKDVKFERIRRITGYLVGTMDRWNNAKKAEEKDRVKHNIGRPDEWRDNCDSYYCPACRFECDNPNRLEDMGVYCPRCGKQLRWNVRADNC